MRTQPKLRCRTETYPSVGWFSEHLCLLMDQNLKAIYTTGPESKGTYELKFSLHNATDPTECRTEMERLAHIRSSPSTVESWLDAGKTVVLSLDRGRHVYASRIAANLYIVNHLDHDYCH